ncbi:MAG: SWIM zinc finger family protein [Williamsia sp.]|nr:SWIM zinc finger family protein [Williamsia sp.]
MNLSEEQILQLAPDEASRKAGLGLAGAAKWVSRGVNDRALWGECQGSGSKPYQTQVDLSTTSFKCSCPSRKFPCKHGLGLLLLYARQSSQFKDHEMPPWVAEWIQKREKGEQKATAPDKKVDEAAQQKRGENREKKVGAGIEELLRWIKDIVRGGFMQLPDKQPAFWEGMAKRMVDAQAGGLATLVKQLGETNFFADGWQTGCIEQLLSIYLIAHAYKNREGLSAALQQDVRALIGFTQNQENLKEATGITDTWLVLGKQVVQEEQLTVERYWLYGTQTAKSALVLQFLVRAQGAVLSLTPGMFIEAELVYYPSAVPLRALIKKHASARPVSLQGMMPAWRELRKQEVETKALFPFLQARPCVVEQLTPVWHKERWWLLDKNNELMEIAAPFAPIWKLAAISGGKPLDTALVGRDNQYEPIGVWENGQYKSL